MAQIAGENSNQNDIPATVQFHSIGRKRLEVTFDEPELSSDGGALLIREMAEVTGVVDALAGSVVDKRSQPHVTHSCRDLIMQRVTQICLGYEDANDCNFMRKDWAIKAATNRMDADDALGSQPTMSRLENSITVRDVIRMFYGMIENFLDSYSTPPAQIVLDIDPTACHTYGSQELALYNTHYGSHCLMPFHVYEGLTGKFVATVIRPGKTPTPEEVIALLKRIVGRIRKRFPKVEIIVRGDSHHCKPDALVWMENNNVDYVIGLATNAVLQREVAPLVKDVDDLYRREMKAARRFHSFEYAAGSWGDRKRRVVARVQSTFLGPDARFIVTSFKEASAKCLYEIVYSDRGSAELMIKEHKCFLHSDRTSCNSAVANQFRLMISSAAYVIMHAIRERALAGTEFANATFQTIRLRFLKVAARVEVAKTFIRFHLAASAPAPVRLAFHRCALLGTVFQRL